MEVVTRDERSTAEKPEVAAEAAGLEGRPAGSSGAAEGAARKEGWPAGTPGWAAGAARGTPPTAKEERAAAGAAETKELGRPANGGKPEVKPDKGERAVERSAGGTGESRTVSSAERPVAPTGATHSSSPGKVKADPSGAEGVPDGFSFERRLLPAKSNEFIVLHTIKQQEVKAEESSLRLSAQTRAFTAAPEARKPANAQARARTCATVRTLLSVYLVFHGCPKTMREEAQ